MRNVASLTVLFVTHTIVAEETLVQFGSPMAYLANGVDPGIGLEWTLADFDDSGWPSGTYGVGWTWIILAEVWANAENGLGYLLEISYRRGRMDRYFAVVIVIVAIAVAFDQLWRLGSRLLFPYRYVA